MLIGYARVSTQDQNLTLQREALINAGCEKVFEDKVSGTRADRPGLSKTLEMLREGDTLVVWKLDRLGRSVKQLVDMVSELNKQGIQFKSLTDSIDIWPLLLSCYGQPCRNGEGVNYRTHTCRARSR